MANESAKPYEPTPREQETMTAFFARQKEQKPAPSMRVINKEGVPQIGVAHPKPGIGQALLMEALGMADLDFADGLIRQLADAGRQDRAVDERALNFMLAIVKGIEPRDQVEAMLAAQMAAVHNATMTFARRRNHVDNIPQQDSAERAFNKLARTFAAQVEALKRYRTGGQQKVTVEHVTVNAGGQAIVGSVAAQGAGAQPKSEDQPHALTYAPGTAMPSAIKAELEGMRIPRRQRTQCLPNARCSRRSAHGESERQEARRLFG
jgi:hypothetical protein